MTKKNVNTSKISKTVILSEPKGNDKTIEKQNRRIKIINSKYHAESLYGFVKG